jgi:F0F1-type ATP synthase membrane subunit c/vacuolar-type H+-ATPase subunit K
MKGRGTTIDVSQALMVPRILFAAMVASVGVYILVGYHMIHVSGFEPAGRGAGLKLIMIAMGAGTVLLSFALPRLIGRLPGPADVAGVEGSYAPRADTPLGDAGAHVDPMVAGKFLTRTIIALALCEATAIFGLVIVFLTGELTIAFGMAGVSLLAMALHFPRRQALLDLQAASNPPAYSWPQR